VRSPRWATAQPLPEAAVKVAAVEVAIKLLVGSKVAVVVAAMSVCQATLIETWKKV
jgi:hypothetical protein